MIVRIKPTKKTGKDWSPKDDFDFSGPKRFSALVRDGKYHVAIDPERLKELEKETGYDLSLNFTSEKSHPFWDSRTATVKLENKTEFFDTDRPMDEIKVGIVKASPIVANSPEEVNPTHRFVIESEVEEARRKASTVQLKRKGNVLASKMDDTQKRQMIHVLSGKLTSGKVSDILDVEIDNLINKDVKTFLEYAQMKPTEIATRALLAEAVLRGVITKDGPGYFYGGEQLGFDQKSALEFLGDKKNQKLKLRIMEIINS